MEYPKQFETVRPYQDHEVNPAIERMMAYPQFKAMLKYLYEGADMEELVGIFRSLDTVYEFQHFFSEYTVHKIIEKTSGGLTTRGSENITPGNPYLFVGNHRDIVLDAAIMQWILNYHGHNTSQITFGSNLMKEQFLLDLGKLNKMFTFFRGGSRVEQYRNALNNSAYINFVIKEYRESIWIAHRNGRTKNGDDRTQTGLIKMLAAGSKNIYRDLADLNIVPVTISYETEPCDIQKIKELYVSRRKQYVKAPDEDYHSILAGITGEKGRIGYAFGTPLNAFITGLEKENLHPNEIIERITREIDRQIHRDFALWPGNYAAYDILHQTAEYDDLYTGKEKLAFEETMAKKTGTLEGFDPVELRTLYLEMYANPVNNRRALDQDGETV